MSSKSSLAWVRVLGIAAAIALLTFSVVKARAQSGDEVMIEESEKSLLETKVDGSEMLLTEAEVEGSYYLPYPGVLPDHPLYFIKMIRDRVVEVLTLELMSKADLWSLYADKRFGAGMALVSGNKVDLGVGTYEKAIKYQTRALEALTKSKEEGKEVGGLANKIEQATTKYRQVIAHQEEENEQFRGSSAKLKEMIMSNKKLAEGLLGR